MKLKKVFMCVFSLFMVFALLFTIQPAVVQATTGTVLISGTVSLPDGRIVPAGGLTLDIYARDDKGTPNDYSDDAYANYVATFSVGSNTASYELEVPENGNYYIAYVITPSVTGFLKDGYYSSTGTAYYLSDATILNVETSNLENIDFTLLKSCTVTGTVELPQNETAPAGGLEIFLYLHYYTSSTSTTGPAQGVTISEGTTSAAFTIEAPQRNDYYIVAMPYDKSIYKDSEKIGTLDCTNDTYSGIKLVLNAVRKISGTVSLPNSKTAPSGGIPLYVNAVSDAGSFGQFNLVIPEGSNSIDYTIEIPLSYANIEYKIECSVTEEKGYYNKVYFGGDEAVISNLDAETVNVSTGSISGINMELLETRSISGMITLPDDEIAQDTIPVIVSVKYDGSSVSVCRYFNIQAGSSSVNYSLPVLPHDNYRITSFTDFEFDGIYNNIYTGIIYTDASGNNIFDLSSADMANANMTLLHKPTLSIDAIPSSTTASAVTVSGTISDPSANVFIKLNGDYLDDVVFNKGSFSSVVNLAEGLNTIIVNARNDNYGSGYMISPISMDITRNATDNGTIPAGIIIPDNKPQAVLDPTTGIASVKLDSGYIKDALSKENETPEGTKAVTLEAPSVEGSEAYRFDIPSDVFKSNKEDFHMVFKTEFGTLKISNDMMDTLNLGTNDSVGLSIKTLDTSSLDASAKSTIGNHPVIELNVEVNGTKAQWENANSPVTVSIPYKPTAEEMKDPEHIVVYYIDGEGKINSVPSGKYDPVTGLVTFQTTHFSIYAISFKEVSFKDLKGYSWAENQIETLAAKGVINAGSEYFKPEAKISRADFAVMLVRALNLTIKFDSNFSDIKSTDYFSKEVGILKALGITGGVGNNKFNPKGYITRQDMIAMADRALQYAKNANAEYDAKALAKFNDTSKVAAYALPALSRFVSNGLIQGSGSKLNPLSLTTKAEAAVLIYKLYNF